MSNRSKATTRKPVSNFVRTLTLAFAKASTRGDNGPRMNGNNPSSTGGSPALSSSNDSRSAGGVTLAVESFWLATSVTSPEQNRRSYLQIVPGLGGVNCSISPKVSGAAGICLNSHFGRAWYRYPTLSGIASLLSTTACLQHLEKTLHS